MNNLQFALAGAWKVLLVGILLGSGLPAIFALGIRALAYGVGGDAEIDHAPPHPVGKALAALCFLIVFAGIVLGITIVAASGFGKAVSFEHVIPTLVDK